MANAVAAAVTPGIDNDVNLTRVAQFLPYFVMGLQLRPEHFLLVQRCTGRLLAIPAVASPVLLAYSAEPRMSASWFWHDRAAQDLGVPAWLGAVMYLALFDCAVVMMTVLCTAPVRKVLHCLMEPKPERRSMATPRRQETPAGPLGLVSEDEGDHGGSVDADEQGAIEAEA